MCELTQLKTLHLAWSIKAALLLAFAASSVAACDSGAIQPARNDLRTSPAQVDLGLVWLGHAEAVTLDVSNASRGPLRVSIRTNTPKLSIQPIEQSIPAGSSAEVLVALTPVEVGVFDGDALVVEGEGRSAVVQLLGEARTPPDCAIVTSCAFEKFSPKDDGCVQVSLPDGAGCEEPCITQGVCSAGFCLGAERNCPDEDNNACTVPACDYQQGCILVPRSCSASSVCSSTSCDPAQGCLETPRPDGFYCGEPTCDQDHVCIAGACVARKPPDDRAVIPCLRGNGIIIPPGQGLACTVTLDERGICWGSVQTVFSDIYPYNDTPDHDGPYLGSLGPVRVMWSEGNPLVLQRPNGQTYYQSLGGTDWILEGLGTSGRGLHHLPEFDHVTSVAGFLNGLCGVTPGKELICKGFDQPDPGRMFTPTKPAISYPAEVAEVVTSHLDPRALSFICARTESGTAQCRDPGRGFEAARCTEGMSHDEFEPLAGFPPLRDFDGRCGVTSDGNIYCHVDSTIPGAHGKNCHPPLRLPGIDQVVKVQTPCALRLDGTVWCWGEYFDSDSSSFIWPLPVPGLDHVIDFGIGYPNPTSIRSPLLCGVRSDGLIKCVGENRHGAVGVFEGPDGGPRPDFVPAATAIALPDASVDLSL